jgi:heme exporter protein B
VSLFLTLLRRELRLSLRHGADTLGAVLFFVLAGALFPLAIGPAPEVLARLAPGVVWVCALLAALLPLDRLFGADLEDGSLDQLLLSGLPAPLIALGKAAAHWLTTGVPLLVAAAPLALMLRMDPASLLVLLAPWRFRCWARWGRPSCWAPGVAVCCCRCWCCPWRRRC